jgi:hypothetical protein
MGAFGARCGPVLGTASGRRALYAVSSVWLVRSSRARVPDGVLQLAYSAERSAADIDWALT